MFDRFDQLMERFGVLDIVSWYGRAGWLRERAYSDGAWLEGHSLDPIVYWGA